MDLIDLLRSDHRVEGLVSEELEELDEDEVVGGASTAIDCWLTSILYLTALHQRVKNDWPGTDERKEYGSRCNNITTDISTGNSAKRYKGKSSSSSYIDLDSRNETCKYIVKTARRQVVSIHLCCADYGLQTDVRNNRCLWF